MGCGRIFNTVNPKKFIKQNLKTTKAISKGNFKTAYRESAEISPVQTKLAVTEDLSKKGLQNPYIAAGATAIASAYGPVTGAAVGAVAAREQGKVAAEKAKKATAKADASLRSAFKGIEDAITGPSLGIPDEEEEEIAVTKADHRLRRKRGSSTLLSAGLGGGGSSASISRPLLLGG